MFIQVRRLSLIKNIPNYGKQKKYKRISIAYGDLIKNETANNKDTADRDAAADPYPVNNLSNKERKERNLANKIKDLETVEEKIFKINMPRYYGWKTLILNEHEIPYNSLTHAQHITRTHIMKEPGLPAYYDNVISNEQLDNVMQEIKGSMEANIIFEYYRRGQHKIKETLNEDNEDPECKTQVNLASEDFIQRINRTMLTHLSARYPHLLHAEVDYKPRLEASWFFGIDPSIIYKNLDKRNNRRWPVDQLVTTPVQYNGHPLMHLRHKHPLREVVSLSECENPDLPVPTYEFSPKVLSYRLGRQHLTNIPGFWPGDESEFGFLSYHNCAYLKKRPVEYNDNCEAFSTQAVLASYSWLFAQACYQGFSTFNDITYPLTTQTIITDGQWWSFFVYQLNTTLLHSDYININAKRNMCWITEPMKLFDKIENEKVHGLNEQVLKTLIKFYANAPEERQNVNLKPYLGESVKMIADIEHDERRNWLEKRYKHLMCNRPRDRRIPEIYQWQQIYMIRYKTRPMDKRREPWEYNINVFKRRLDDHTPQYIPRFKRENPKKNKIGRWENMYYP